jgi:tRNA dimethylallyltransferase
LSTEPSSGPGALDGAPLSLLTGLTAVGKTDLSLEVAERAGAEIVSMDSMLVYRGLDIGTAKPAAAELARVPHHGIDLVDPPERYDVRRYLADAERAVGEILARGRRALFVGGTGFYLQALIHGVFAGPEVDLELRAALQERAAAEGSLAMHAELARIDPQAAARLHPNDEKRVLRGLEVWQQTGRPISSWQREWGWDGSPARGRDRRVVGLMREGEEIEERIRDRTGQMLAAGWAEEAVAIREGVGFGPTSIQALGYREVLELADGLATGEETRERIALRTRQFARRQRTWFRRFPEIEWIDVTAEGAADRVLAALGWSGES